MRTTPTLLAVAGLLTAGLSIATAQTPQQTPQPAPTRTQPPQATQPAADTLKIVGCLKAEKDVAGLKPNIAERAGITEDYILTAVKAAPDSPVSALGLGTLYEIEGIAESEIKKHLNHQVEFTGRLSTTETGAAAANAANRGDVPDFHATSMRMIAATCPAK